MSRITSRIVNECVKYHLLLPKDRIVIFLIPHPLAASRHPGESRDPEI